MAVLACVTNWRCPSCGEESLDNDPWEGPVYWAMPVDLPVWCFLCGWMGTVGDLSGNTEFKF